MSEILHVPVVVVGAGGTGLCAAIAASDAGADVVVLERDAELFGSTGMSTGLIPAAGTKEQEAAGIIDSPALFTQDIMKKTRGSTDEAMALHLAESSAETIAWLRDTHHVPLTLADGWLYPGHSAMRMYGTPTRSGRELMTALENAALNTGVMIVTNATVTDLIADDSGRVQSVKYTRPDGETETIMCDAVILACSGFGGNAALVEKFIPEMAAALFHGHPGNKGDALRWGQQLGAAMADLDSYQGHGGLAAGYGVPILWPLIMEGGVQVNKDGNRFSDETQGYSEQAAQVNAQPGHVAYSIFDQRLHELMLKFDDYVQAWEAGAVAHGGTYIELAEKLRLPESALTKTMVHVQRLCETSDSDEWGRRFGPKTLAAPFYGVKVTGALFHTQGGLIVDKDARVLRPDASPLPNLFAGGGAARGISGTGAAGYMAGNGLLTATTLGKLAGRAAAIGKGG